jgi:hypothetical protein
MLEDARYDHKKAQEEAIGEALMELLGCSGGSSEAAYEAIVAAIDGWLKYHQTEMNKWKALLQMVTGPTDERCLTPQNSSNCKHLLEL